MADTSDSASIGASASASCFIPCFRVAQWTLNSSPEHCTSPLAASRMEDACCARAVDTHRAGGGDATCFGGKVFAGEASTSCSRRAATNIPLVCFGAGDGESAGRAVTPLRGSCTETRRSGPEEARPAVTSRASLTEKPRPPLAAEASLLDSHPAFSKDGSKSPGGGRLRAATRIACCAGAGSVLESFAKMSSTRCSDSTAKTRTEAFLISASLSSSIFVMAARSLGDLTRNAATCRSAAAAMTRSTHATDLLFFEPRPSTSHGITLRRG
mmetsp:Transcript_47016/g.124287  ORF Transcript_47016/g.124287 Transcript_47016/m.124287 type:complete len:270 (+) Transcript_47016:735-1544(+)